MTMRLRILALTCTASLLGISAAAYAQEERQTGVYAGASFGQATMDFSEDALPIDQPTASKTVDAKGNAGKLFAGLGTMYSTTKTSLSATGFTLAGTTNPTRRETNLHYGVGVDYSLARHIGARFEYDRTRKVGDLNTGEADISIWAVGLMFKF